MISSELKHCDPLLYQETCIDQLLTFRDIA